MTVPEALASMARLAARAIAASLRAVFVIWIRLRPRARLASALAFLVVMATLVGNVSQGIGAMIQGLAVLLLAGVGLAMILRAPFRRRV